MSRKSREDPPVRTRVFGGPEFEREGVMLSLSPYQAAFIGLVGTSARKGVTRRRVAWLLWEEDDGPAPRQRIRQLLFGVKRKLGVDPVRRREDALFFNTEASFLDAIQYREFVNIGRLHHAAIMLREGLLSSLHEFPTDAYADWVEGKEVRLRRELREKASMSWTEARAENDWIGARDAAEALICIDPDDEHFVRLAIEGRAMTGDVEGAEAAFVGWTEAAVLRNERPEPVTVDLVNRVRGLHTTVPRTSRHATPQDTPPPPFQGQESTLRKFLDLAMALPEERASVVVVEGEPGIGKTRIAEEVLAELHLAGHLCMMSSCSEFERQIPLNPLVDAICADAPRKAIDALVEPMRSVLLSLLPPHALDGREPVRPPPLQPDTSPRRLLESFSQMFEKLAESEDSIVLVVDDIQWIDESSISVLEFIRRRWSKGGLMLVFTYRPEELKRHELAKAFVEGLAEVAHFIEIPKLPDAAARTLVREVAPEPLPDVLIQRVAELGYGNPLYLLELATEAAAGRISPAARGVEGPLPPSIRQLVERRLRLLTPDAGELLEHLCVLADSATLHELAKILGRTDKELAQSLADLLAMRLGTFNNHRAGPPHELLRSAVEQQISPPRKAFIHGEVAQFLASRGAPPGDLAIHFAKAGKREEAYRHALTAADQAEEAGAIPETVRYLELAAENAATEMEATLTEMRVGMLKYRVRDFHGAVAPLERAHETLREQGQQDLAMKCEIALADALTVAGTLSYDEAIARLDQLRTLAIREGRPWLASRAIDTQLHLSDRESDLPGVAKALAAAKDCLTIPDPLARCLAYLTLSLSAHYGSIKVGLSSARQALSLAQTHGFRAEFPSAVSRLLVVLNHQGLLGSPEGAKTLKLAEQLAKSGGNCVGRLHITVNRGVWLLDIGEYDQARHMFTAALELLRDASSPPEELLVRLNLGELESSVHNHDQALAHFMRARKLLSAGNRRFVRALVAAGLGSEELWRGNLSTARGFKSDIPAEPGEWHYDPTLIVRFRVALMERRGLGLSALDYLRSTLLKVRRRFVPSWTKLKLDELRLRDRLGVLEKGEADEVLRVARELGLTARVREVEELLRKVTP